LIFNRLKRRKMIKENVLEIKKLVSDLHCMGTYGMVELELTKIENYVKELECEVKNLSMPVVKHRFFIDDPIIVKAYLDIRSEHVCSNPLRKPEETDRQLKGYLVELLNSLNGD